MLFYTHIFGLLSVYIHVQGDKGEKVNILTGDNIGHCDKKS
jgi:hypothetical protein